MVAGYTFEKAVIACQVKAAERYYDVMLCYIDVRNMKGRPLSY